MVYNICLDTDNTINRRYLHIMTTF